jgi:hypothetical protein
MNKILLQIILCVFCSDSELIFVAQCNQGSLAFRCPREEYNSVIG